MTKFWEMLDKSVVISGALAVILVGGCVVMAVVGRPIPEAIVGFAGMACGYFFGAGKAKEAAVVLRGK